MKKHQNDITTELSKCTSQAARKETENDPSFGAKTDFIQSLEEAEPLGDSQDWSKKKKRPSREANVSMQEYDENLFLDAEKDFEDTSRKRSKQDQNPSSESCPSACISSMKGSLIDFDFNYSLSLHEVEQRMEIESMMGNHSRRQLILPHHAADLHQKTEWVLYPPAPDGIPRQGHEDSFGPWIVEDVEEEENEVHDMEDSRNGSSAVKTCEESSSDDTTMKSS